MGLMQETYRIALGEDQSDPDPVILEVKLGHGDTLKAELEMTKYGIRDAQARPLHFLTIALWCATVRAGLTVDAYKPFEAKLQGFEQVGDEEVPPTRPATLDGSPLPSPPTLGT